MDEVLSKAMSSRADCAQNKPDESSAIAPKQPDKRVFLEGHLLASRAIRKVVIGHGFHLTLVSRTQILVGK